MNGSSSARKTRSYHSRRVNGAGVSTKMTGKGSRSPGVTTCGRVCIRWVTTRRSSDFPTPVGPHNKRKAKPPGSQILWVSSSSLQVSMACSTVYCLKTSKRSWRVSGKGSDAGIGFLGISDTPHRLAHLPGSPEIALPLDVLQELDVMSGREHVFPQKAHQGWGDSPGLSSVEVTMLGALRLSRDMPPDAQPRDLGSLGRLEQICAVLL